MTPRYVVGSVTGFTYYTQGWPFYVTDMSSGGGGGMRKPRTTWYVQDRLFGYRTVKQFDRRPGPKPGRKFRLPNGVVGFVRKQRPSAEEEARHYASELNKEHEAWLRALDERR